MPTYMLDTDSVSLALRGQGRVADCILDHRPSELCISSITLAELHYGAEKRRSRKLRRLIRTFTDSRRRTGYEASGSSRGAAGIHHR